MQAHLGSDPVESTDHAMGRVRSMRANRPEVDGESADWGIRCWMDVGTSGLGDSEKSAPPDPAVAKTDLRRR